MTDDIPLVGGRARRPAPPSTDFEAKLKLVFASCGCFGNPAGINRKHDAVERIAVSNTACIPPGVQHKFLTPRRCLHEFAPLLFQN